MDPECCNDEDPDHVFQPVASHYVLTKFSQSRIITDRKGITFAFFYNVKQSATTLYYACKHHMSDQRLIIVRRFNTKVLKNKTKKFK